MNKEYEEIVRKIREGEKLPANFDKWELADNRGWTVAHVAARNGHLPVDFNQWDLAEKNGYTVAHIAAEYGYLPTNFDQWDLADKSGWTVAHIAAKRQTKKRVYFPCLTPPCLSSSCPALQSSKSGKLFLLLSFSTCKIYLQVPPCIISTGKISKINWGIRFYRIAMLISFYH